MVMPFGHQWEEVLLVFHQWEVASRGVAMVVVVVAHRSLVMTTWTRWIGNGDPGGAGGP